MSSSGPRPFKLSIKKTGSQQPASQAANGAVSAGVHDKRPGASGDAAVPAIAHRAPSVGAPRTAGLSLKGASYSVAPRATGSAGAAPKSGFLKLKGQSQASPAPAAASAPSPAPHAAATPSSGPKLGLGLKLKGQGSKAASTPATPVPAGGNLKQQAMAIALGVQQEVVAAPGPSAAPRSAARPASTPAAPRPAAAASTSAAARPAAGTPGSGPPVRKFGGIKLKGAAGPRPSMGTPSSNTAQAAAAYTPGSAAATPARPRITLNKSRGMGSVSRPPTASSAARQYSYQPQQEYKPPRSYNPPASSTAAGYGSSSAPMERSLAIADAAALAASSGAETAAVPASTPAYGDYGSSYNSSYGGGYGGGYGGSYAAPAAYRSTTGQKRGRPPGSGRPRDATGLGGAVYQTPLGPRSKKPKIGAFRDREKDEESEDEDFNPKAERLSARRAAAAAAARHRPSAGPHRGGYNRAATAGHRAASNRAAAAVAAAAARHAHAAAAAAAAPPRPQPPAAPAAPAAPPPMAAADAPMSAADAAAAFARMTSTVDGAAAFGLNSIADDTPASAAAAPTAPAAPAAPPAHPSVPAAVAAHMRGGAATVPSRPKGPLVDPQLLHEVNSIEESNAPTRDTMMKLLHAVDKRDKYRFFVQPVTDSVAPGYSKVIQHPMDLSTMKSKVDRGMYNTWADLQSDLVLMFTNAKTYNQAHTVVYKQADLLLTAGLKMVKNFKQGKMKVRGFQGNVPTNGLPGAPAAAAAAAAEGEAAAKPSAAKAEKGSSAPATREKRERPEAPPVPSGPMVTRQTRRGKPQRHDEAPVQKKIRGSRFIAINQSSTDVNNAAGDGDSARDTYRSQPKFPAIAAWRGLADGANPEGVPYGVNGKPVLRCVAGHINNLHPESYLKSLTRFVSGAGSAVEKLVTQLYGNNLQLLVPIKGVLPAEAQQRPAAPRQAPLPHQLQQMQQQQQMQLQQQQQQQLRAPVPGVQQQQPQQQIGQAPHMMAAPGAQQPQQPQQFVPGPHTANFLAAGAAGLQGMQGLAASGVPGVGGMQVPGSGLSAMPVGMVQRQ